MVALDAVRASNTTIKTLPSLVAVFVGGTSGIGLYTARELVRNTTSPHIYLIGRNQTEATAITHELQTLNPSSRISFIQKDISLLHNVDSACQAIAAKEHHVNLLFMTCGYLSFAGRDPTSEGLDRKFALHYYARMRFIEKLQPLLDNATTLSRVVSVLDPQPGLKRAPNFDDLSLKNSYSLGNCMTHASAMTNLAFAHLAERHTRTAYVHAFPFIVDTGVARDMGVWGKLMMWVLLKGLEIKPGESGERHLFAATSGAFAPKTAGEGGEDAAIGSDGVRGSGSYLLNWNGDVLADTAKAKKLRDDGMDKVWGHTEEVFRKVCVEGGKY